jgi:DNA-binding GntR family transcriptional regulator
MLFEQELKPGEKLNIEKLARHLRVSPTPVREALARLEADGLVTKAAMRGYSVEPLLDMRAFSDLYEVRLSLEPVAAGHAALRARESDLEVLEAALEAMRLASTGGRYREFAAFAAADAAFHDAIAVASGNPYLRDALYRMHSHQHLARLYVDRGIVDAGEAIPDHEALLEAVRLRDAESANLLMRLHLGRSQERLGAIVAEESVSTGREAAPTQAAMSAEEGSEGTSSRLVLDDALDSGRA